jgi:hypothetical protein
MNGTAAARRGALVEGVGRWWIADHAVPARRVAGIPPAVSTAARAAIAVVQHIIVWGIDPVAQRVHRGFDLRTGPGPWVRSVAGKDDLHHTLELDRNEFWEYATLGQKLAQLAVEGVLIDRDANASPIGFLLVPVR